jgi:hypothetical protein
MAIEVNTDDPMELLNSIRTAIDLGSIETWSYEDDKDFFHQGPWKGKGWLHPTLERGALVLNLIPPTIRVVARSQCLLSPPIH